MTEDAAKAVKKQQRGLGRGLNALFEDEEAVYPQADPESPHTPGVVRRMLGVDMLEPGPFQPRQYMNDEALEELARSVAMHGVLQPILVRPKPGVQNKWQIIAGERRWRAAQKANLHEVPIIVREFDDETAMEIGLIENLQREDLNPLEEAQGYKRLMEEFKHTQEKLAEVLGKSRSHVANTVRLLNLPVSVQVMVHEGELSAGHARALVNVEDPETLAKEVIYEGLSVRQTEIRAAMTAGAHGGKKKSRSKKGAPEKDTNTLALEKDLTDRLGYKVVLDFKQNEKGGRWGWVKVEYKDLDQLEDIITRLSGRG